MRQEFCSNSVEEWDAGFYDCSYGTCPNGHRRIIDDWRDGPVTSRCEQ
ncbi:MAG: hypothetical protein HY660_18360 [Armatimonadetes bacterium]|nr:hypothetical protein [Armatimonadota bacterium]